MPALTTECAPPSSSLHPFWKRSNNKNSDCSENILKRSCNVFLHGRDTTRRSVLHLRSLWGLWFVQHHAHMTWQIGCFLSKPHKDKSSVSHPCLHICEQNFSSWFIYSTKLNKEKSNPILSPFLCKFFGVLNFSSLFLRLRVSDKAATLNPNPKPYTSPAHVKSGPCSVWKRPNTAPLRGLAAAKTERPGARLQGSDGRFEQYMTLNASRQTIDVFDT